MITGILWLAALVAGLFICGAILAACLLWASDWLQRHP